MSRAKSLAALGDNAANLENAIANVADDSTPQLGANLDVNSHSIVSTSNGNISITPNGSGKVILDGLSWPTADGSSNQVLKTDGSGNLSFTTVSGGGSSTGDISFSGSTITSSGSIVTIDDNLTVNGDMTMKTSDGAVLNLQTSHTSIEADDVLGAIDFKSPDESSGTDAIALAGSIRCIARSTFSSSENASKLSFFTSKDSAAVETFYMYNDGAFAYLRSAYKPILFVNQAYTYAFQIFHDGNSSTRYGLKISTGQDNPTSTNYAVTFEDGDFTDQGYITFTNGTVNYGAFSAYHEVSVPDSDNPTDIEEGAYPYGTLVEIKNIYYKQKNSADTERGIRYNVQKAATKYSRKVLGAYSGTMNNSPNATEGSNLHQVGVLGDGHIICNNEGGNISIGDGICVSSSDGIGMKADKMCMCIGIAQENITFSGSETKLVPCQFNIQQFTPWTD